MILETNRLYIRALTPDELEKYSNNEIPFNDQNVVFSINEIDDVLRPVLEKSIIPNVNKNRNDYLFYTLWLIIEKKLNLSVGSIMFKGRPDNNGKVEIGYGTHKEFRNKGYMSEAVGAICSWAFDTGNVKLAIAETAKDNPPSFRVVEKNNFFKYEENENFYYWKKVKNG